MLHPLPNLAPRYRVCQDVGTLEALDTHLALAAMRLLRGKGPVHLVAVVVAAFPPYSPAPQPQPRASTGLHRDWARDGKSVARGGMA